MFELLTYVAMLVVIVLIAVDVHMAERAASKRSKEGEAT